MENLVPWLETGLLFTGLILVCCNFALLLVRQIQRIRERGNGRRRCQDATTLKDWSERFDNVIDSGLFHVFSDEDRKKYVEGLATVLKTGGRVFLMCFSNEEPGT
jgi:cyclopropane fatty-acyl-phospholipid synthase-like methyltransferase